MNFNQREKAFEDMFAADRELQFKIRARRNKLAGLWAAQKMGKTTDAAASYALDLVTAFLEREQLFTRLKQDFSGAGIEVTDAELVAKLHALIGESRKYFME